MTASTTGDFSKLKWLKRTDGHKFTLSEFRVLISLFNHSGSQGKKSHPGIELMMRETGLSKGVVSAAVTSLKERGWVHETFRGSGYSKKASQFDLIPDAPNPDYAASHSSGHSEPCEDHSSDSQCHSSESDPVIVTATRNPSDPGSDPEIRSWRDESPGDSPSDHARSQEATKGSESFPMGEESHGDPEAPEGVDPEEAARIAADLTKTLFHSDPWARNPLDPVVERPRFKIPEGIDIEDEAALAAAGFKRVMDPFAEDWCVVPA
ncbi:hypothetical protein JWS13_10025 [Rhodococcus pseudokoreensis]|uniref:Helix-turn-helix domain-containing protein n=1 Tax=Rhodococcus pseudokoreensis TaxID=2811421 RepID=A0A974W0C0_9NOCA|nr:helix-turn-helix domain-containing protein [Rhodococcus pseudokoreensis]QSE88919.1 hypothetical protein JWS13_10025 [Rhodococcus pseudokoreensis]